MSSPCRRGGVVALLLAAPASLVLAYGAVLAWNLHVTDQEGAAAQEELREQLQAKRSEAATGAPAGQPVSADTVARRAQGPARAVAHPTAARASSDDPRMTGPEPPPAAEAEPGTPLGELWFERDGERFLTEPLTFVSDTGADQLALGPGHYSHTPLPGEPGNAGIAGHRTTYGAPFGDLDELERGDHVVVTTATGTHRYEVARSKVVAPDDVWVLGPDPLGTGADTLTLTTCHPRFSDRQRLVVWAEATSA